MAESKGNIQDPDPEKGQNVQSVTDAATHPADKTSAPVELPTDVNRPPVSTNDPEQPIAQSNISGDMGPTPEPEIHPETHVADNAYVSSADKDNIVKDEAPKAEKK